MLRALQSVGFTALWIAIAGFVPSATWAAAYSPNIFDAPPGEIIISQHLRKLFFALPDGRAIVYSVAVPKKDKEWRGLTFVDAKYIRPAWSPPASVLKDIPNIPRVIAGGSPHNPMGVRALSLSKNEIAIHGTNRPNSIGKAVSYGCIRMHNRDVRDLFARVRVGTPVIMVP